MSAADRLAEALLRLAARRWPAEVREEQAREWAAELHALRTEPGAGAGRRALGQLRFAFSLAAASPVEDEQGVPRGWREGLPEAGRALQPMAVLVIYGVVAAGPGAGLLRALSEWLLGLTGVRVGWPPSTTVTVTTSLPALLILTALAWWIGRRGPVRWARLRRLGSAGPAAVAPLALAVAFAVMVVATQFDAGTDSGGVLAVALPIAALCWMPLTAALAVTVVRLTERGRWWRWCLAATLAAVGIPLVVELAVTVAALPLMLTSGADLPTALAWAPTLLSGATGSTDPASWHQSSPAIALLNATNSFPLHLLLFTGLALGYGLGAARPRAPRPVPLRSTATAPLRLPPSSAAAGVVCLLAGLFTWAYTLAVLTPAMPLVGQTAPMPGGDGELYMWVAELRWGGVTLAALGLLLAAADRRAAPLAAAVQTVVLLTADGMLARVEAAGPSGLRAALAAAALAAALSWGVAGRRHVADALVARRRLAWTAVTAACCAPFMLGQGTPEVNHPYLPIGLAAGTALVPAMLAVLAVHAAAAARPVRMRPSRLAALTAGPALLLGAWGAATGAGASMGITMAGMLLTVPMTLMVVAVMRTRRRRRGWAGSAIWTTLVLAGPALSALVIAAALVLSMFAANLLFAIAGSSWAADGLSLLPGAVVLALPMGVLVARRMIRADPPSGQPVPTDQPLTPQPSPARPAPHPGTVRPAPQASAPLPAPQVNTTGPHR